MSLAGQRLSEREKPKALGRFCNVEDEVANTV
jgi:hypothetical protein